MLIERGVDVNAQRDEYGAALQAVSFRGHKEVMSMLVERGTDANAQGGLYGNLLRTALCGDYKVGDVDVGGARSK